MTRDGLIRLCAEVGIEFQTHTGISCRKNTTTRGSQHIERIERFAALVAAAEREACAELCDLWNRTPGSELAKEIRKRSTEFLAEVDANRNGGA